MTCRKYLALLLLCICIITQGFAQGYSGLIGRWPMNGNANDVSGHGLNGIVYNATPATGFSGLPNTAYSFNGVNSTITIPYNSLMNSMVHSFCVLIKPTGFYNGTCQGNFIIARGAEFTPQLYQLEYFDGAWDNSCTAYSPAHETFAGATGAAITTDPPTAWYYPSPIALNTWYCVVLTYDGDSTRIYVDGTLKRSFHETCNYAPSTDSLSFGKSQNGPPYDYYLNGVVDEIRIYNRVLSPTEVNVFCDSAEGLATTCDTIALQDTLRLCSGSSATLSPVLHHPDSVLSVLWTPASGLSSASVLSPVVTAGSAAATYYLTVTEHGCTLTDSIRLSVLPVPVVHLGNDTAICASNSLTLISAQPAGSTYAWSTGSTAPFINVTASGTYVLTVNNGACSASDTIAVAVDPAPAVNLGPDISFCNNGTIANLSGIVTGSSYLWNTGATSTSIPVFSSGIYWLRVTANGCMAADTIAVTVNPTPVVNLGPDITLCTGETIADLAVVPPGSVYVWSTGSAASSLPIYSSGSYWLQITYNGCTAADTINVTVVPSSVVHLGNDTTICQGSSVVLSCPMPPGYTYAWSTGSPAPSITVSTTGLYWLITYIGACTSRDTILVTVNPFPVVDLGRDTAICQGKTVTLSSSVPYLSPAYSWNTGAHTATITVGTSGTYILNVDQGTCVSADTVNVTVKPLPLVYLGADTSICDGASLVLSALQPPGAQYLWNTGSTASAITIAQPGTYGVVVTNNGCRASDSIMVTTGATPAVNLGPDTTLCQGETMELQAGAADMHMVWSDESNGTAFTVSSAGIYWVTVSNNCGTASDSVTVDYMFCDIWLPTAFTPNNDGKNDVIHVLGSLEAYTDFSFNIFNRWGQLVFTTKDIYKGWNGLFNGVPQEIGTYYYYYNYSLNGRKSTAKGSFELIR